MLKCGSSVFIYYPSVPKNGVEGLWYQIEMEYSIHVDLFVSFTLSNVAKNKGIL